MKVLILGGNGMMGHWVIPALAGRHQLLVTDINAPPVGLQHEYRRLDVANGDAILAAAEGMDAIVNLSVVRDDRRLAFDVNVRANYNLARAAVKHGIQRIINTGPHNQIVGPSYTRWDADLHPDMPPRSGTQLYPHTKALGQEVLRVFSEHHDLYVQTLLFAGMRVPGTWWLRPGTPGSNLPLGRDLDGPFVVAWPDTGTAVRAALEVELARLPSRCESYFVLPRLPHHKFSSEKMTRVLGWEATYGLEAFWIRPADPISEPPPT
jgi:hypothetical protein